MGNINKVDYDVLEKGKTVYMQQAEVLNQSISDMVSMNGELAQGWTNQTADAFFEKFENDYKPALNNVVKALEDISEFINKYSQARIDEDARIAGGI